MFPLDKLDTVMKHSYSQFYQKPNLNVVIRSLQLLHNMTGIKNLATAHPQEQIKEIQTRYSQME